MLTTVLLQGATVGFSSSQMSESCHPVLILHDGGNEPDVSGDLIQCHPNVMYFFDEWNISIII